MRRATCCSPTPGTRWNSPASTSRAQPVSIPRLQVSLYKVQWRWWWDQSGDSLAQYAQSESTGLIQKQVISTSDGRGQMELRDQVSRVGPLPRARLRSRRRTLHGPRVLHRLAELGRRARASSPARRRTSSRSLRTSRNTRSARRRWCSCPRPRRAARCSRSRTAAPILEQRWLEAQPGANRVTDPDHRGHGAGACTSP